MASDEVVNSGRFSTHKVAMTTPSANNTSVRDSGSKPKDIHLHEQEINLIPETIHETYYSHQPEPVEPSLEKGISWTPLLEKDEKNTAKEYGFSFGSKKVNMGPAFLNLDLMCRCLAKAVKKHLDYSKGKFLFLEDLQEESDRLQFSYKFNPNLKFPS